MKETKEKFKKLTAWQLWQICKKENWTNKKLEEMCIKHGIIKKEQPFTPKAK